MSSDQQMRVLITGASGFVGKHVIRALMELRDVEVIATTDRAKITDHPDVRFVELDVTDAEQVAAVISAEQPTHLLHLAGVASLAGANRDVRTTWEVNAQGALHVAFAIQQCAPQCRLLFCSSAQVYGGSFRTGVPLAENAPIDPINLYAASKAAPDLFIRQMAKNGLRAICFRPFNHTGAGQAPDFVVPSFASQIAAIERGEQEPVIKVGNLAMFRDFLDVRDVVDAYVRAILRFDTLPNGAAFNLASGHAVQVEQLLKSMLMMSSTAIEVRPELARMRPDDTPVIVGNADAARKALDWTPKYPLTDTLKFVLDDYRNRNRR
jgi:GDP-4-dehydro-6-deoxy-D-mannose reductase